MGVSDNVSVIKCPYMGEHIPHPHHPPPPSKERAKKYAESIRPRRCSRRGNLKETISRECSTEFLFYVYRNSYIYYPRFKRAI